MNRPSHVLRIDADGLADGTISRPGPVSVWIGSEAEIGGSPPPWVIGHAEMLHIGAATDADAPGHDAEFDARGCVLLPGLVNAHTHLDLTAIGITPYSPGDGFVSWADMVRTSRPTSPEAIGSAIELGVQRSLDGGVVAVGDILGAAGGHPTTAGLGVLAQSPLKGVGYVEFFGIGRRTNASIEVLDRLAYEIAELERAGVRPGVQPHAPNTVSVRAYRHAAELAHRLGLPMATHLAETPEERRFVRNGTGPHREFLERLGIWDDGELEHIGHGRHPIEHLGSVLSTPQTLVAHVNDIPEPDAARLIGLLARSNAAVAYCPRASAYFGAPDRLGPHRYREMLDAGVNVCLGTDSIINLDTPGRISPLDEARLLYRRDGTEPRTLMEMMTCNGARALGLDPLRYRFRIGGALDGLVAVPIHDRAHDPAVGALLSNGPPRLLFC